MINTVTNDNGIELIRWAFSITVPAIAGLVGIIAGAWLTGRRERNQRRHAFAEKQIKDFYSPMLGLRNEIKMRSELRNKIQGTAGSVWSVLCEEEAKISREAIGQLSHTRFPEFKKNHRIWRFQKIGDVSVMI